MTPRRHQKLDMLAADLAADAPLDEELLTFCPGNGFYLYWNGVIAASTYWMCSGLNGEWLQATVSHYRWYQLFPALGFHMIVTEEMNDAELEAACGGLDYPPVLVRPMYAFQRKPADQPAARALARLPRR